MINFIVLLATRLLLIINLTFLSGAPTVVNQDLLTVDVLIAVAIEE